MTIIEPHIHMVTRTTDDYMAMYRGGIRAVVEPSFWPGVNRRYAGSFFDCFRLLLDFEETRARRYGIDHYACVAMNPKEADDPVLAREVIEGLGPYLDHQRCLAIGEIGFNRITRNEEEAFLAQLEIAKARGMLVVIHSPHDTPEVSKRKGVERTMDILRELKYRPERILVDHNTERTIEFPRRAGVWAGMTVYPYSKLDPQRVMELIRKWGSEQMLVNSSADWGVSDPLALPKLAAEMARNGFEEKTARKIVFENPLAFYRQSGRFEPSLDLPMIDPREYQR
jgi:predicted metal-dependent TIM-barrel fold hydrolase